MPNYDEILNAYNQAKENTYDNTPLPAGEYYVKVEKIELGETKKEPVRPMGKIQFRILEGQHKNKCLFWNKILVGYDKEGKLTALGLKIFDDFLNSLEPTFEVSFSKCKKGFEDYKELLLDVAEDIEKLTYTIELTYNGDFPNYKVVDVFE
jgi:hypothetical protein